MNRRHFLKLSSLVSLGGLILPSTVISACRKNTLFEDVNFDGKVIIIGAGAAGLYSGYLLHSQNIDFEILEASSTYGGRMGKREYFTDYTIDTGAQWLHGRNNILGDLIANRQIQITEDDSDLSYWFNNQIVTTLPKDPFIFENENMPDISFKEYAIQQGFGSEYNYIIEAIAGDQGAAADNLSAYWNSKDEENWCSGDTDYKFQKSYFDIINEQFALPIQDKIKLNTEVIEVNYSDNQISVKDKSGKIHTADKVIITVPISILKLNEIKFIPEFTDEKKNAFSKFGMGAGMKVFLKFKSKFYEDMLYGGEICGAYVDDTLGKNTNSNVLLAFVMGHQAEHLDALGSDNDIVNALLNELDLIYDGVATQEFIEASVHNYTNKPFIKGAYGYSTIGMGDARIKAAKPIDNKLFFAGEAMNINGHHQTVHGAVESGYKAIIDILNGIK